MVVVKEIEENGENVAAAAESSHTTSNCPKSKLDGARHPSGKSGTSGSSSKTSISTNDDKIQQIPKVSDIPISDITSKGDSKASTAENTKTKVETQPVVTNSKAKVKTDSSDISAKKMDTASKQKTGGVSSIMKKFESSGQSSKAEKVKSKTDPKPVGSTSKDKVTCDKADGDKKESGSASKQQPAESQTRGKVKSDVSNSHKKEFASKQQQPVSQSKESTKSEGRKIESATKQKPAVSDSKGKVKSDLSEGHITDSAIKQQPTESQSKGNHKSDGDNKETPSKQQPTEFQSKGKVKPEGHKTESATKQKPAMSDCNGKVKSDLSERHNTDSATKQQPTESQSKRNLKSAGPDKKTTSKQPVESQSKRKVKSDSPEGHITDSGTKQQPFESQSKGKVKSESQNKDTASKQPAESQSKGKVKPESQNKDTASKQPAESQSKGKVKPESQNKKFASKQQPSISQNKAKVKSDLSDSRSKESASNKQPAVSHGNDKNTADVCIKKEVQSVSVQQPDMSNSKGNVTDVSDIFKKEIKSVSMQEPDLFHSKRKDRPDGFKTELKSVSIQESDPSISKGKLKSNVSDRVKKEIKSVSMEEPEQPEASTKSKSSSSNLLGKKEKTVSDILSTEESNKMEQQKDGSKNRKTTATKVGENQKKPKNKAKNVSKEKYDGPERQTQIKKDQHALNSSHLQPSNTNVSLPGGSKETDSDFHDDVKSNDSTADVSCGVNETSDIETAETESNKGASSTKDIKKSVICDESISAVNGEVLEVPFSSAPEEIQSSSAGKKPDPVRPVYNSKHWIKNVKERLKMAEVHDEVLLEFSQCKSDTQRFACLYMQPAVHEVIHIEEWNKGKSEVEARVLRTSGNKFFQRKEFKESLEMYSESILKAPVESYGSELALAFANRSAVFYHLKLYVLCIQDIQLALKYGYPEHNQYKIYERKGKCCYHLKMKEAAISAFEKAIELAEKAKLPEPKINKLVYDLEKELDQIEKIKASCDEIPSVTTFNSNHGPIPSIEGKKSYQIPCMSADVELNYSDERGRGLFAKQDIEIGEVLIIEKPYCSVLLKGYELNHCHHCCTSLLAPLPCPHCSGVAFCSEECQLKAWESYHYAECKYLVLIEKANIGMSHLALRMVLKAGFSYIKQYEKTKEDTIYPLQKGCNKDGIYDSSDYHTVFNLEGHSKDRSTTDLLQRTLTAIFLVKCLKRTSYFPPITAQEVDSDFGLDEDENHALIGSHILRHIQMLPCNAHEVSELECNAVDFELSEVYEFGSAIYPVLSLINHSCDPSVVRHSYGDLCVVRAIRNIYKNEELFDNYGALYAMTKRAQRQEKLLSQYYFQCVCLPCINDWPLYIDVPQECPVLKCKKCHGPIFIPSDGKNERAMCSGCREVHNITHDLLHLSRSEELYQSALEKTLKGQDLDECLPILVKHLRLLDPLLCRPWRDYNNCQEAIKQCYSTMGNCIKGSKD